MAWQEASTPTGTGESHNWDERGEEGNTKVHQVAEAFWEREEGNDDEMSFYDGEGFRHVFSAK